MSSWIDILLSFISGVVTGILANKLTSMLSGLYEARSIIKRYEALSTVEKKS